MGAVTGSPTIGQALAEFLEVQRARLARSTYRKYEEIIELLRLCLNGYGHQYLDPAKRRSFEEAYAAGDEEAFCQAGRAAGAARDLPRAQRLGDLLYELAQNAPPEVDDLPDDAYVEDLLVIARVEPGALWFEGDLGRVKVPKQASELAEVGWSVNLVLGRTSRGWQIVEVGSVYPG